ncbi:MAG TPA: protein translocase subunit SecD, partial [Acidimicrobiaceae bacterium]|nr:protein translocase subunit SecD [Acidimicrobiaceae bacterium]
EGGAETSEPSTVEPNVSLDEVLTPPERDEASSSVVLLGSTGQTGFVLAPAQLTGEVIEEAVATFQNEWIVNVSFNDQGAVLFDQMAAANFGKEVAIVLDGVVESAPTINATEFDGQAVISGAFGEDEAKNLALVLRFGALPVEFERDDVRTVSATLGEGTLRAGVVAGLVGLALVGLYMLAYYRLLGLVAICSLAVSGATLWSIIAWLGESQGLALTLAGATGIIVSIGVQVDSNIVYYERIKEEVRRGRAVRSAADGSFKAAFATIVWADLASLIGAGVLYQLTTGTVRGFALYLGITTLIDLAVSFFFMRPLVVFIARRLVKEKPSRLGLSTTSEGATL